MKYSACALLVASFTVLLIACGSPAPTTTTPPPSEPTPLAPTATLMPTAVAPLRCTPTFSDEISPTYKPDAPIRSVVGHGHVLTGIVRSSENCAPIPNVKLEFWSEDPGAGHPDEYRATLFTDSDGAYRFECNPTDHVHMRISAEGYVGIASNAYHTEGQPAGTFDIVLKPEKP